MTEKEGDRLATLKCKYCGGNISPFPDNRLGTCSDCGATMTLPANMDKQTVSAHNCGNYFRRAGKFDKALAVYQKLLTQDETDAESCWCSALCRFGVQYVEEGGAFRPVVLRPESGDFPKSGDYLAALAHSGGAVQLQYTSEAAKIAAATPTPSREDSVVDPLAQGFRHLSRREWAQAEDCFCRALESDETDAMAHLGRLLVQYACTAPRELAQCAAAIEHSPHYSAAVEYGDEELTHFLETAAKQIRKSNQRSQIEQAYRNALAAMDTAGEREGFLIAGRQFRKLNQYKDSHALAQECFRRAEDLRKDEIYHSAQQAMAQGDPAEAAKRFSQIPQWKDANVLAVQCQQRAKAKDAATSSPDRWWVHALRRVAAVFLAIGLVVGGGYLFTTRYLIPQHDYNAAQTLLEAGNREEAIEAFQALGDYRDSHERALSIQEDWYRQAENLLELGDKNHSAVIFGALRDYSDAKERSRTLWAQIIQPEYISAGGWFSVALRNNAMVSAIGDDREDQCGIGSWLNIASVSAGWEHTLGLRTDGTVIAAGYNGDGRGDVDSWRDIVAVSAGQWHTVGLKSNGRVIGLGCSNDGRISFDSWRNIIGISAGRNHTVALEADYTALATGDNSSGQCNVSSWSNLRAVSAGGAHTLGLRWDGTVIAVGEKTNTQCRVDDWSDITAVSAGYYHSVGLKSDGTVVATGDNTWGQCDVGQWTDIVAISAGGYHTLGLKADGSIVATGQNANGQCDVSGWDNLMLPTEIED